MASGSSSRAVDVHIALQRAKRKIDELKQRLDNKETSSESPEASLSTWMPNKELRDSLVDMYKANPRVNTELRQRLPSPARQQLNNPDRSGISLDLDHSNWPHAPQHLQDPATSPPPIFHQRNLPVSPPYPQGSTEEMEVDLFLSRGSSPRADSCGASRGPGSPDFRRHLVTTEDSFHQNIEFGRLPSFDRDKNISFLLKEVDALRDINKKLQEQLVQKERELQRREVEEELRGEQREAQDWERPAVVLEEVLAAQKERDQALMSRLLLANEERDEALLRARRLQQAAELDSLNLENSDVDVDKLLQCICDAKSVQEVQQCGSVLVQRVHLARQRQNEITAQEMKAVMKERDGSVAKCKCLEQDLIQEREQRVTKEELLRLQRERDEVLEESQRLEAELRVLQANHRCHDLLTHPPSLPGDSVSESRTALPPVTLSLQMQLQQLSKEKQNMEAELQRCQEAEREACERVHRLERLVEVLRRKVGTGSLRAVI